MITDILVGKAHPFIICLWKTVFFIPSQLYRLLFVFDQFRKKRKKHLLKDFHKKLTISIGNITLGGSGKTMLGLSIAEYFAAKGKKVTVVLRGYKGALAKKKSVQVTEQNQFQAGDEAQLYYQALKDGRGDVMVGKDKVHSWKIAQKTADIVLLDDGFQRPEISRDFDFLSFDDVIGKGNGALFPAGYLRQPLKDVTGVQACFIKTGYGVKDSRFSFAGVCNQQLYYFHPVPKFLQNLAGEKKTVSGLASETVFCFCAIGNPYSFFSLAKEKLSPFRMNYKALPDHFHYTGAFFKSMEKEYSKCSLWLCTAKDFVKIQAIQKEISHNLKKKLYFLGIDIKIYSEHCEEVSWEEIFHQK